MNLPDKVIPQKAKMTTKVAKKKAPSLAETKKKEASLTKQLSISEDELQELKTAFHLLDKNQDGMVSVSEFQHMLKNFGIDVPDKVILALIKQASATGEPLLKENEFLEWISTFLSETPEDITEDLIAAFRVFDKDQNGYITKDELKEAMDMIGEPVTEQELNNLLELADIDQDGRIDYEEFAKLLL